MLKDIAVIIDLYSQMDERGRDSLANYAKILLSMQKDDEEQNQ